MYTTVTKVFDDWLKFIDSDTPVGAVFLDFKKAFDCVRISGSYEN